MPLEMWALCLTVNIKGIRIDEIKEIIDVDEKIEIPFSANNQEDAEKQGSIIALQLKEASNDNLKIRIDHYCDFPIDEKDNISVRDFSILFEKKLNI